MDHTIDGDRNSEDAKLSASTEEPSLTSILATMSEKGVWKRDGFTSFTFAGPTIRSPELLSWVALQPECDTSTLDRLVAEKSPRVRLSVARNPRCPAGILQRLARDSDSDVRQAAEDALSSPAERHARWADSPDVQQRIAAATESDDSDLLEKLTADLDPTVRYAMAKRPTIPRQVQLLLMRDPVKKVRNGVANSMLRLGTLPQHGYLLLVEDDAPSVRRWVAANAQHELCREIELLLAMDADKRVRDELRTGSAPYLLFKPTPTRQLSPQLQEVLDAQGVEVVLKGQRFDHVRRDMVWLERLRQGAAPDTPAPTLTALADDPIMHVRVAVADNPRTPPSVLQQMATRTSPEETEVFLALASNTSTPPHVLETLTQHSLPAVRDAAQRLLDREARPAKDSRDTELPHRVADSVLVNAEEPDVRAWFAEFTRSSRSLEQLSHDEDRRVRAAVARSTTDRSILTRLAEDSGWDVRAAAYGNVACPIEILREAVGDTDMMALKGLATNPNTPVDVLEVLSDRREPILDGPLSLNPACPAETLVRIYETGHSAQEESDLKRIAAHPNAPADLINRLAGEPWEDVREIVAENPLLSPETMRRLASDPADSVRYALADNPRLPLDILGILASDPDFEVRCKIARNDNTPLNVLRQLAFDPDSEVRYEVASSRKTPLDILRDLSEDVDADVREAAVSPRGA